MLDVGREMRPERFQRQAELLRRLNLMSVFTYLETRFHPTIRTLASALWRRSRGSSEVSGRRLTVYARSSARTSSSERYS